MEAAPRKRRRRRRLAIATGVVSAILAVWWVAFLIRCNSADKALEAALNRLRDRGEPTTLQELLQTPQRHPNGAADLMRAILLSGGRTAKLLRTNAEVEANVRELCGGIPEIGREYLLPDDKITLLNPQPGTMREFYVTDDDVAVSRLRDFVRKAVHAPAGRLPIRISSTSHAELQNAVLWDVRTIKSLLRRDVDRGPRHGDNRAAWESLIHLSKLGGALAEEPCSNAFLEKASFAFVAVNALGTAIGDGPPEDDCYDRLDRAFTHWKTVPPLAALRGEFFAVMQMLGPSATDELRQQLLPEPLSFQSDYRYYTGWARRYHFTSPLGRADRLDEQRRCIADFEAARGWIERRLRSTSNGAKELPPSRTATFPLPGGNLNQRFQLLAATWDRLDAASFIARTALRVDRYRRIRGRLPDNLHQAFEATSPLDSQFSLEPQDWLGGYPVVYRRTETGFSLEDPNMANDGALLKATVDYGRKTSAPR